MANSVNIQTIADGPKNLVLRLTGVLDTSNVASTLLVDPALLNYPAGRLRLDEINWDVQDLLSVEFFWDAPTPVRFMAMTGRSKLDRIAWHGGIPNNAVNPTGRVLYDTLGWTSGVLSFDIKVHFVKLLTAL